MKNLTDKKLKTKISNELQALTEAFSKNIKKYPNSNNSLKFLKDSLLDILKNID